MSHPQNNDKPRNHKEPLTQISRDGATVFTSFPQGSGVGEEAPRSAHSIPTGEWGEGRARSTMVPTGRTGGGFLTLLEMNDLVAGTVNAAFARKRYWIVAEISNVSESQGHCYVELVQKSDAGDSRLVARARATIWRNLYATLRTYFLRRTGRPLQAGMQVLVQATPTLHPQYGYALNITDIDPDYTLGDLARRRQEILRRLDEQGIRDLNKELPLPRLLQRIAVISSETAAGYQDFLRQLTDNPHHLAFHITLFPAILQGDRTEPTVIAALDAIAAQQDQWDAVAILRGGGATADLGAFDSLALAEHVANFPLPVITGIGHERDDTIIDLIAHTRLKTPTAVADFLIEHQRQELEQLLDTSNRISRYILTALANEKNRISQLTKRLPLFFAARNTRERVTLSQIDTRARNAVAHRLKQQHDNLDDLQRQLTLNTRWQLQQQHTRLTLINHALQSADPIRLLRLGYSITRHGGYAVTDPTQLHPGDQLTTTLAYGSITSTLNAPQPS